MQTQIRWKGCPKSESAEGNLAIGLSSLEDKYEFLEPTAKCEIVAYKNDSKKPYKVRINLFCTCKKTVHGEDSSDDINSAISGAIDKCDDQCRRLKTQKQNHNKKEGCKAFSR